jgi:hypothetical protein
VLFNSDDDNPVFVNVPITPENMVIFGVWRVTIYQEADNVQTDHFTGYNFTFGTDNSITANNVTNIHSENWSFSADDIGTSDFNIFFASPDNFAELPEDWDVLESTSTKLRLKRTCGGDGNVDYLTF